MATSSALGRLVWYALYEYTGVGPGIRPTRSPDAVRFSNEALVFDFGKAVRDDNAKALTDIDITSLQLFANYESFVENSNALLQVDERISSLGMGATSHIVMLMPRSIRAQGVAASIQFRPCRVPFFVNLPKGSVSDGWLDFSRYILLPVLPGRELKKLHVRESTDIHGNELEAFADRFLITGTPGIGKSL